MSMEESALEQEEKIRAIVRRDGRYPFEAYLFILEGLEHTIKINGEGQRRHVTGRELSEGLRDLAIDRFGLMARTVLDQLGIHATSDFGELVYHLIEVELLSKTEEDSKDDFHAVYDFDEVFS